MAEQVERDAIPLVEEHVSAAGRKLEIRGDYPPK